MATAPKKTALSAAPAEPAASPAEVVAAPAPSASSPMFGAPAATLTELQDRLRAAAEKGLAETRSAYVKAKVAAGETADALETSCAAARAGVVAINAKALESLTANVEANFDFIKSAFGVAGFADYVALQSEFARARLDAVAGQAKAIGELAQKTALDSLEPIKAQVAKSFKLAL
ncbi:MAG: phasin family protein [Roseiarcus sp.]|jgi:phasin